jgi:hypothetical protein
VAPLPRPPCTLQQLLASESPLRCLSYVLGISSCCGSPFCNTQLCSRRLIVDQAAGCYTQRAAFSSIHHNQLLCHLQYLGPAIVSFTPVDAAFHTASSLARPARYTAVHAREPSRSVFYLQSSLVWWLTRRLPTCFSTNQLYPPFLLATTLSTQQSKGLHPVQQPTWPCNRLCSSISTSYDQFV